MRSLWFKLFRNLRHAIQGTSHSTGDFDNDSFSDLDSTFESLIDKIEAIPSSDIDLKLIYLGYDLKDIKECFESMEFNFDGGKLDLSEEAPIDVFTTEEEMILDSIASFSDQMLDNTLNEIGITESDIYQAFKKVSEQSFLKEESNYEKFGYPLFKDAYKESRSVISIKVENTRDDTPWPELESNNDTLNQLDPGFLAAYNSLRKAVIPTTFSDLPEILKPMYPSLNLGEHFITNPVEDRLSPSRNFWNYTTSSVSWDAINSEVNCIFLAGHGSGGITPREFIPVRTIRETEFCFVISCTSRDVGYQIHDLPQMNESLERLSYPMIGMPYFNRLNMKSRKLDMMIDSILSSNFNCHSLPYGTSKDQLIYIVLGNLAYNPTLFRTEEKWQDDFSLAVKNIESIIGTVLLPDSDNCL